MFHRSHRWVSLNDDRLASLPEGGVVRVEVGKRAIAVARVKGVLCGVEDRCPHQAALLSKGTVQNGHVVCPVHRFHYDVVTGACRKQMTGPVRTFPLREMEATIQVGLPCMVIRLLGVEVRLWSVS